MGLFRFKTAEVAAQVAHAKSCKEFDRGFGQEKGKPGLFLVGDAGVYLMSSGKPHIMRNERTIQVAYAIGCNPYDDPDECDYNKRRLYGGDDGSDWLPLSAFEPILKEGYEYVVVNLGKTQISVTSAGKKVAA